MKARVQVIGGHGLDEEVFHSFLLPRRHGNNGGSDMPRGVFVRQDDRVHPFHLVDIRRRTVVGMVVAHQDDVRRSEAVQGIRVKVD
jgi:hypothetical protein